MSYNGFGDEGTALFSRPLRHNATLRYLSLAVNHIGPFGAERLAAGICGNRKKGGKKSKCAVRSLDLSRNGLGKSGILVSSQKHVTPFSIIKGFDDFIPFLLDRIRDTRRQYKRTKTCLFHPSQLDRKI